MAKINIILQYNSANVKHDYLSKIPWRERNVHIMGSKFYYFIQQPTNNAKNITKKSIYEDKLS